MSIRYGANGMPMVEKKKPEALKQPVVQQPAPEPVKKVEPAPVSVVHNDVEEGNVSTNNE